MKAPEAVAAAGLEQQAAFQHQLKAQYVWQPRCLICIRDSEEVRAYQERSFIMKDLPDECRECRTRVSQLAITWTGGLRTEIRKKVYSGLKNPGNAKRETYFELTGGVDPGVFKTLCNQIRGLSRYEDTAKDAALNTGQFGIRYAFNSYEAVEDFLDLLELQKAGNFPLLMLRLC